MYQTDTIAAIATALSDSGIGIVRISGENAIEIADSIFCSKTGKSVIKNAESHTIHYGFILDDKKENIEITGIRSHIIDEGMASVFYGPKSYTAEDTVELNCHGGILVVQKVLESAIRAGARLAQPGEFTKRAFLNGRIDLSKAEAVMDIIHSKNDYALRSSVNQLRGDLSEKIRDYRAAILYEIAFIESALDDPEHISLEGYEERITHKLNDISLKIEKLLETAENGRIIKDGISTVILGKPNAGKSSLLNMILGQERAIVTDIAGTTRDILQEAVKLRGINLNMIDTAGIRNTEDAVEKIGVEKAKKYAEEADLILYVVDTSVELDENDKEILSMIGGKKTIFLFNKSDMEQKVREEELYAMLSPDTALEVSVIHTSAKEKEGMDELEKEIERLFFKGELQYNEEVIITNLRHKEALQNAYNSLLLVKKSIEDQMPEDFYSIDLMEAYASLGRIIGEEVGDDLVEEIFSKFCMGK